MNFFSVKIFWFVGKEIVRNLKPKLTYQSVLDAAGILGKSYNFTPRLTSASIATIENMLDLYKLYLITAKNLNSIIKI